MRQMNDGERLSALEFQRSGGVEDWRVLALGASAWFTASSHAAGAEFARRALAIGATAAHLPDIDVRATGVRVRTRSHHLPGLSGDDVALAREVSAVAHELGLTADPSVLQSVQLTIDTAQTASQMRFWRAALSYEQRGH